MSRPLLLLQREEYWIKTNPVWGIEANAVDGNYYHWKAKISGLKGTSWEGGIFSIEMNFNEEYDSVPPKIIFLTVPFHPNIDMTTGKPCVDFLDNDEIWKPGTTITGILQSMQLLLAEPVLDNAVNIFAAQAYSSSPHLYNQLVKDSVVASRKVEAGLSPYNDYFDEDEEKEKSNIHNKQEKKSNEMNDIPKKIKKISFDDYYQDWINSATYLPKLNESRFKRYSHNPDEYHINRNKNQNLTEIPSKVNQSLSKCAIEGVEINENKNKINLAQGNNEKTEDPEEIKKKLKSPNSSIKTETELSSQENKYNIEESKIFKKHDLTNIIDKETDQIDYIMKFFGHHKKYHITKASKKYTTKMDEVPEVKVHHDLNSYDNIYYALMSTKKIIKEKYNCQEQPVINVRDGELYQYKFGCRYLNIINVKDIESNLDVKLNDEDKLILNKILENEIYYNIFIEELEKRLCQLKDTNDNNNNDTGNDYMKDINNDCYKSSEVSQYDEINRVLEEQHERDIEKIIIPYVERDNTELNENYITEFDDIIQDKKYVDVDINVSKVVTPITPSIYNDEYEHSIKNYNNNSNNMKKFNNHSNNNDINNTSYHDNEIIRNGEDPDGILDWCASLDQTKVDNIALI